MSNYGENLKRAIRFLAGNCDGAVSHDGQGFNGRDAAIGHSFANQERDFSARQAEIAAKFVKFYRKQLTNGGFDVDAILAEYKASLAAPAPAETAEKPPELRVERKASAFWLGIEKETNAAYLVKEPVRKFTFWIPKSQIKLTGARNAFLYEIELPDWLARKNGLNAQTTQNA